MPVTEMPPTCPSRLSRYNRRGFRLPPRWIRRLSSWILLSCALTLRAQTTQTWTPTNRIWDGTGTNPNWDPGNTTWTQGNFAIFDSTGTAFQSISIDPAGVTTDGLTFNATGYSIGGTGVLTLGGSTPFFTVTNSAYTATVSAQLAGTSGFTVNGQGTLVLSGNNSGLSGTASISSGTVRATSSASALGGGTLTLSGGALQLADDSGLDFGNNTTVSGSATIVADRVTTGAGTTETLGSLNIGDNILTVNAGANVTSGTAGVTFGATTLSAFGATFNVGAGANLTLGGAGAATGIAGAFGFFKQGAGTLTLAAASGTRASGGAYVTGGALVLGGTGNGSTADSLGSAASTPVDLFGGVTLDLATGASSATGVAAHPVNIAGGVTVTINPDANTASTAGFVQTLGALTLVGANSLVITPGANIGSGTATVAFGAATTNAATTFTVNNSAGATGQLTLTSTLGNGGFTMTFNGAGNATVTGVISGGGGLAMNGSGGLTLSSANTYTGVSSISGGSVTLGNVAGLGAVGTAVLNMTGGALNLASVGSTLLALSGNSSSAINSTGAATLTVTPVANSTSSFAGAIGGGGGVLGVTVNGNGAFTLSGNNSYTGATTLSAGQLNINSDTAIGAGGFALASGIIDNTSGSNVTLSTTNNVTLSGNFSFGGSGNLNLGPGTLTEAASQTVNLLGGSEGHTLTVQNWTLSAASETLTATALPGSSQNLSIGAFNSQGSGTAGTASLAGDGNISITGGIVPAIPAAAMTFSSTGTSTLTGASTYTGATTFNSGTVILDATGGTATLAATAPIFSGGTFIFKGNASDTGQTLGNLTVATGGASTLEVVSGAAGTALTLGSFTDSANGGALNINLSGAAPSVTTTTLASAWTNGTGARAAVTFTSGGTTSFATLTTNGANNAFSGLTISAGLPASGSTTTVNYILTAAQTVTASESINALQLNASGGAQTLTINSSQILGVTSGGILNTGSSLFTISGGTLESSVASVSDLILHNFGSGGLNISSVIANGNGASVVTLDGTGTTTLSGVNTYTGVTVAGGGAVVDISADSGLGAVATGAALTLNNATLQAGATFTLDNSGSKPRPISLGSGGGIIDTQANTLTIDGVISSAASGLGSLTKIGNGTLILTGNNTYTGGFTYIQNGALQLGSSTGAIAPGSFIVLGSSGNSGVLILGDSAHANGQTVAGLFTSGSGAGNAIVGGGDASASTLTFTGSMLTPSVFAGVLGGSGANQNKIALAITSGQLTLSGTNTYTGGTTLTGGVLNMNSSTAIGAGALAVNSATAVIDNTSGSAQTMANNNKVTTSSGFVFAGSNNLSFGSGTLEVSASNGTIAIDGGSTLTFTGSLLNQVTSNSTPALRVDGSTGVLSVGGFDMESAGGSALTYTLFGSGNINITGAVINGSEAGGNPNGLAYSGTGVLTLSGAPSTYTGGTTISSGTVRLATGGSLPSGGALTLSGGSFDLGGINQSVSLLTLSGSANITNSSSTPATLTSSGLAGGQANLSGNLSVNLTLANGDSLPNLTGIYTNAGNITLQNAYGTNSFTVLATVMNIGNVVFDANNPGAFTVESPIFNPAGKVTNSGTGTGTTTIFDGVGSNVTGITENSVSSALTISNAAITVNSGGTTLTNSNASGTALFTVSGGVNGNGALIINDNSSTAGITISTTAVNNAGTITNSGSGAGATTISAVIGGDVTGIVQNSATSTLTLSGNNANYTGGMAINSGSLIATNNAGALGAAGNVVTLGATSSSSSSATLQLGSGYTYSPSIIVAGGSTGLLTIEANGTGIGPINLTGAVTLDNNLTVALASNSIVSPFTIQGAITGAGNLSISNVSPASINFTGPLNFSGTITNSGSSIGTTTLSGGVGSNVTAIAENGPGSSLTISGALTVNSGGTMLTANSNALGMLTVTGGVNGSGPLLINDSNFTGITLSTTPLNNSGTITNTGSGTGQTMISATIGANVTGIVQNSANSTLALGGSNSSYAAGIAINNGSVLAYGNAGALGSASNVVTLGATSSTTNSATLLLEGNFTYLPSVIAASGSSGQLTIEQNGTTASTGLSGAVTLNNNLTVALASSVTTGSLTLQSGITGTGNLTISNASASAGTINFTTAPLNFTGTITNSGSGAGSITISSNIGSSVQGVTQNSATSSLTLAGTNTYTAPTAVNAGTLVVSGSLSGSVNVAGGATLASGNNISSQIASLTVASSPSATGGIVAPGGTSGSGLSSIGQLNVSGSAAFGSSSSDANAAHLQIEIGGTGDGAGVGAGGPNTTNPSALQYDRVAMTNGGPVTLTNVNLDITTVNGYAPSNPSQTGSTFNLSGHIFFLITGASSVIGTFANQGSPSPMLPGYNTIAGANGQFWAIDYSANFSTGSFAIGAGDDVAIMAIPEPDSASVLAGGLGLTLGMQRFRRRTLRGTLNRLPPG